MFDLMHPIFKWLHIFAGIIWIGLLYFFNFVNGAFAATMDGNTKKAVVPELMPRALYWFRWGAAWTWFSGIILLIAVFWFTSVDDIDDTGKVVGKKVQSQLKFGSTASGDPTSDTPYISKMMDSHITISGEKFTDADKDGKYDEAEPFTDINKNNKWDPDETYVDLNKNKKYDIAENFVDANNNGVYDPERKPEPELDQYTHIMLAITFLAVFIYDFLYKKVKFGITCPIANNTRLVTIVSFILIGAVLYCMTNCANWDYRTSNIHIGAMFGTIMAFNVWFRIWPAQQKIITAIKNGEAPDGDLLALAGLRSKHNTYLSLPLIWTMINAHTAVFAGKVFNYEGGVLLVVIALGWHIIFQCYKKSAKVKGF